MVQAYEDPFQELINSTLELNDGDEERMAGPNKKPVSKVELMVQSMMVMAASYKIITTLLPRAVYHLSNLPHIQHRLHSEIVDVMGDIVWGPWPPSPKGGYATAYLSQVINETLRIAPPFTRTSRMCTIPITLKGIPFEAGTIAVMPIYAIHHNPGFYEDPEMFDPEFCRGTKGSPRSDDLRTIRCRAS
ncbi:cytochrome P450 CYP3A43.3 [Aphelenchoides avenae]|nr:cytochrome P450 CYP3A43.3 [Aphelenchus avenae]